MGVALGGVLWGTLIDRAGRRLPLQLALSLIVLFGFASAFSPSYASFLAVRFGLGIALAGAPQMYVLYLYWLHLYFHSHCPIGYDLWTFKSDQKKVRVLPSLIVQFNSFARVHQSKTSSDIDNGEWDIRSHRLMLFRWSRIFNHESLGLENVPLVTLHSIPNYRHSLFSRMYIYLITICFITFML